MPTFVYACDQPKLSPFKMSDRFRHEITYFMSIPGTSGVPNLAAGEFWVSLAAARSWLDQGTFQLVSPLDSENQTEVELSEEQEAWLEWMVAHAVERVRLRVEA
jgi:hypothetical protein